MRFKIRLFALLALSFITVTSFQNCGGFQVTQTLTSLSSAQCKAQMKETASEKKYPASLLQCANHLNYACERRVFSPNVKNETYLEKACMPSEAQVCIDVDVRRFDTSGARSPASEAQFLPGASYNHEEIRCYHKMKIDNFLILDGEGDDLESALSAAVHSCESAQGDDA